MSVLLFVIGILLGAVSIFAYDLRRGKNTTADMMLLRQRLETEEKTKADIQNTADRYSNENMELRKQLSDCQIKMHGLEVELNATLQHYQNEQELRKQQFDAQLNTVREEFKTVASTVLEQSADKLKTQNIHSMEGLTAPLQDNLVKLNEAIHLTNQETAKNTASLSQQLDSMAKQTQKINESANRLTNVIRGGNHIQGHWGEMILTELLEQNGFKEGLNFDIQQRISDDSGQTILNDETGSSMRPDVILHYPKNEDVIIDAKMSIEAYEGYMNTDSPELKKKYADELVKSIRTQYMGLAKKDYSAYVKPPRKVIDFVIMFVPNEGALQLALATDKGLWSDAFNKKVFITSQQNLMAILKMIEIAWRQYNQIENHKKLYGLADEMVKRVGEFIKRFDRIKKDISQLSLHYDEAYNKVYAGNQSIVKKANQLKQLGAKESPNYPIPGVNEELTDEREDK